MNILAKIGQAIVIIIIWLATTVISAVICAIPVYFLWNWLMPELFHLTEITFVQSIGISTLSGLLFRTSVTQKEG